MLILMIIIPLCFLNNNYSMKITSEEDKFRNFIKKYNKSFGLGSYEYHKRFAIFQQSLERIRKLNQQRIHPQSAEYGINEFSDLTPYEFQRSVVKKYENKKHERSKRSVDNNELIKELFKNNLPERFDWREKNVVTKVKNQGKCGACWAYSTVETIESMVAIKGNQLQELSIQQLIDCASNENHGCNGGDTCSALLWLSRTNTILQTAEQYPLINNNDKPAECQAINPKHGIKLKSNYTCDNYTNNETEIIKLLVNHGPIVAAVDATSWQDYLGGIIQYHCQNKHNHAVQIVGYDFTGDIPYYIVRNTWGPSYGLNGYIHIAIGNNLCGISEQISALDITIV